MDNCLELTETTDETARSIGSDITEDLLYAECALASCGLVVADKETKECAAILSLIRRKLKVSACSVMFRLPLWCACRLPHSAAPVPAPMASVRSRLSAVHHCHAPVPPSLPAHVSSPCPQMTTAVLVERNANRLLFGVTQCTLSCADIATDSRMKTSLKCQLQHSIRAYLGIAVDLGGQRGTLVVTSTSPRSLSCEDVETVITLAKVMEDRYRMRREVEIANTVVNLTIISVLMSSIKVSVLLCWCVREVEVDGGTTMTMCDHVGL